MPVDQVHDSNGAELYRLAQLYAFPDFVKKADISATTKPEKLAHTAYADPNNRLFPCHTPAATWVSALFFQEKRAQYHTKTAERVGQRLDSFARYHRIKPATDQIVTRKLELSKDANSDLPDSDFAYVWASDDGVKERHLRIKNAAECSAAARWLYQYRDQLPWGQRNTIAGKIMQKSARYGARLEPLQSFIEKQAGHGVCQPKRVIGMLQSRARLCSNPEHRASIEKLAQVVRRTPRAALGPQMLCKLAETVETMDRAMGIHGRYSEAVPRPEDVIFEATFSQVKEASDDACALTSGTVYDKTRFKKIALADVQALFGSDFADEVSAGLEVDAEKMAEQAQALPRPDAEAFDRLMSESGIHPIQAKTASSGVGFNGEQLAKIAGDY